MKTARYAPGLTYYLMGAIALAAVVHALGVIANAWRAGADDQFKSVLIGAFGFVGVCAIVLGWRRFVLRDDGLQVTDVRGTRVHSWEDLGRPRSREFVHGIKDSILFEQDGVRGGTTPQAYSHHLCDARGRPLYRIGPWYPRRREMLREVRRRIREAQEAS